MPSRDEASKVVQANHINVRQQRAQAANPPAIARLAMGVPVVKRIAPELSLRAEIIGRHAGDEARTALLVQQKQPGSAHTSLESAETKKGKSPINRKPLVCTCAFRRLPWRNIRNCKARQAGLIGKFAPRAVERRGLALDQLKLVNSSARGFVSAA
jgi:hypothetical protein